MEDATNSTWIVAALERYESHLVHYATWILGDAERAREVVQETFLRLCREKESRLGGHLAQWLFTVCRNLSFDVRKKENRMSLIGDAEAAGAVYERPLAAIEREQAMTEILRIVATLPKNQREVIRLKFEHDLSYKEIAAITGLSATNVGFLIHTAIQTLRKALLAQSAKGRIS